MTGDTLRTERAAPTFLLARAVSSAARGLRYAPARVGSDRWIYASEWGQSKLEHVHDSLRSCVRRREHHPPPRGRRRGSRAKRTSRITQAFQSRVFRPCQFLQHHHRREQRAFQNLEHQRLNGCWLSPPPRVMNRSRAGRHFRMPQEVMARAEALSAELGTRGLPGFKTFVFKGLAPSRRWLRADLYSQESEPSFPAVVSRHSAARARRTPSSGTLFDRHRRRRAQAGRRKGKNRRSSNLGGCTTSISSRASLIKSGRSTH